MKRMLLHEKNEQKMSDWPMINECCTQQWLECEMLRSSLFTPMALFSWVAESTTSLFLRFKPSFIHFKVSLIDIDLFFRWLQEVCIFSQHLHPDCPTFITRFAKVSSIFWYSYTPESLSIKRK